MATPDRSRSGFLGRAQEETPRSNTIPWVIVAVFLVVGTLILGTPAWAIGCVFYALAGGVTLYTLLATAST